MSFVQNSRMSIIGSITALAIVVCSCGSSNNHKQLPELDTVMQSGGPLIIDWPEDMRAELEQMLSESIVVVAFDGRSIELLRGCSLAGDYKYFPKTVDERVVRISSVDDMRVQLPFTGWSRGAALGGEFERGSVLEVALITVGWLKSSVENAGIGDVEGDLCGEATHFISAVTVGSFAMDRGMRTSGRSAIEIFNLGLSGSTSTDVIERVQSGNRGICLAAKNSKEALPECRTPLRLLLSPLVQRYILPETNIVGQVRVRCNEIELKKKDGECAPLEFTALNAKAAADQAPSADLGLQISTLGVQLCMGLSKEECISAEWRLLHQEEDPSLRLKLAAIFENNCSEGFTQACIYLGVMYETGTVLDASQDNSSKYYKIGCTAENQRACAHLGHTYKENKDVDLQTQGFVLLSHACQKDDALACASLAEMYEEEAPLPGKDPNTAAGLFEKACHLGDIQACTDAGFNYVSGCPRDPCFEDKARAMYQTACEGGDEWGCWWLGTLYLQGEENEVNLNLAEKYYKRGCAFGDSSSCAEYWRLSGR